MSQIIVPSTGGGGTIPPSVPESFATDFVDLTIPAVPAAEGSVVPQNHILRVTGSAGIATYETGNPGDLLITFLRSKGITSDGTSQTFTTLFNTASDMNQTLTFQIIISGFSDNGFGVGCYGSIVCKNVGGVLSIIGTIDLIIQYDSGLNGVNVTVAAVGSNLEINCIGISPRTINWEVVFPGISGAPSLF
jgi:hypothetical protein